MTKFHLKALTYLVFMCITLPPCYAKVGKANKHISSIYINTPDSSVKASITDQPEKNPTIGKVYYWYSANQLCYSNGSYAGKLLHGPYSSFYSNHFLLAQGQFSYGLKDGCWKRWLPDGSLHEIIHYKNGLLNGTREIYSPNGQLRERIYYRKGVRAGKTTIFSQDGKDSVILYKRGEPVVKKERGKRNGGWGTGNEPKTKRIDTTSGDSTTNIKTPFRQNKTAKDSAPTNSSGRKRVSKEKCDSVSNQAKDGKTDTTKAKGFINRWKKRVLRTSSTSPETRPANSDPENLKKNISENDILQYTTIPKNSSFVSHFFLAPVHNAFLISSPVVLIPHTTFLIPHPPSLFPHPFHR